MLLNLVEKEIRSIFINAIGAFSFEKNRSEHSTSAGISEEKVLIRCFGISGQTLRYDAALVKTPVLLGYYVALKMSRLPLR